MSPPSTRYLFDWVANTKPSSHKPAAHSCMHSSCRAICRFCHKSCVGSKAFGALGELGNFCASSTSSLIQAQNTVLSPKYFCLPWPPVLQTLTDFLQHLRGVVLLFFFFLIENPKQFRSLHNFHSLICHLLNAAYILEDVCCQIPEFWVKSFPLLTHLETRA